MSDKWVYAFGGGQADGDASMKALLGGKGANLAEMASIGLPVPPGFTITTEVCTHFYAQDRSYPDGLKEEVAAALKRVEAALGRNFGDPQDPLLVSVRSGGRVSMPGMMDTVLNIGLNDETVEGLARRGGERFAWDSYRRFVQMYANVVIGHDHYHFEDILELKKAEKGVELDTELDADDLKEITAQFKAKVAEESGDPFPDDVEEQLWGAIGAVFSSWQVPRAQTYRRLNNIPEEWGTAVNVQAMVFGNMGDTSATGVAFTRSPATGEKSYYGEFLINAQGEDVVAGIRTPRALTKKAREEAKSELESLEEAMPEVYAKLANAFDLLERHYRDMQDVEFTVEEGTLYILQTRAGKRTAAAALKIATDFVAEGLIDEDAALLLVDPAALDQLLHPRLDENAERDVIAAGLPASPGAASGRVVFTADEAERLAATGVDVILVRAETSPDDIHGMHAARGILTSRGGMTSHAAVVARGMGRPCVAGAGEIDIDAEGKRFTSRGRSFTEDDEITLDGATGEVMAGILPTVEPKLAGDFATLMGWADKRRTMKVRTNAETPADAEMALNFGAEGIGLCRTEHMFFDAARIIAVRRMILAKDEAERRKALADLLPEQRGDFEALFRAMQGRPVTIRLLDPPLHEFLPARGDELDELSEATGIKRRALERRVRELAEFNPMLGHRGCRLGISFPEIYEMQVQAIIEAALAVSAEGDTPVRPEIMVPLVATGRELEILRKLITECADRVIADSGDALHYTVGTMIELPRAALRAHEIARFADFFSFGTNDLTQTTYGLSRDDSGSFLKDYLRAGIFEADPFVTLDRAGVGELISLAVERGRAVQQDLKLGICGEHGGDPASITFCQNAGLDYVSCSPYRVPIARLAAAQAALRAANIEEEAD